MKYLTEYHFIPIDADLRFKDFNEFLYLMNLTLFNKFSTKNQSSLVLHTGHVFALSNQGFMQLS